MTITKEKVRSIFALLSSDNPQEFFDYVSTDVNWDVLGTHPLAGRYSSKQEFQQATFMRLGKLFNEPMKLRTRQILLDEEHATVELYARATTMT